MQSAFGWQPLFSTRVDANRNLLFPSTQIVDAAFFEKRPCVVDVHVEAASVYGRMLPFSAGAFWKKGPNEPGEIRTLDLQVRNLAFWTVSVYPLNYGPVRWIKETIPGSSSAVSLITYISFPRVYKKAAWFCI